MNSHIEKREGFVFTGWHMFAVMSLFFGVIIAVNVTMAVLASGSWTGLVVESSYVASQRYNDELLIAKAQREAGLHSDLTYSDEKLSFTLKDAQGAPLDASELMAAIGRPAYEQEDRIYHLTKTASGTYKLDLELAPGVWAMSISGMLQDGNPYRRDARILVDANGHGRLQ